jgi:branched-chain amino acid aminotransferase
MAGCDFLPQGAYTTFRTYGGTGVILLDEHFDRLEESAHLLGQPVELGRPRLRQILCDLLRAAAAEWSSQRDRMEHRTGTAEPESRVRLTLDCSQSVGDLWVSIEPLSLPAEAAYQSGASALTRPMQRENPLAKDNTFLEQSRALRTLLGEHINEILMVGPDGRILEGLSSNFFAVREGVLYTAEEGVLPGLTRSLVLDEATTAGIPLRKEGIPLAELPQATEAFISSSSRGVLPIVEIDGQPIGAGIPGPITNTIRHRYNTRLAAEIEPICE